MARDNPPDTGWDDDDADDAGSASDLDALDIYVPAPEHADPDGGWDAVDPLQGDDADQPATLLFEVSNPAGTVSATAALDGRVHQIELSANAATMRESQLAEEITVLAGLAQQRARAAQHALVAEFMSRLGHDPVAINSMLERELGLPSPETVTTEIARVFTARYADDHE